MNKESGNDASLDPIAGPSGHITSEVEIYSNNDSTFTVPAARNVKKRKRTFCKVWLENPAFQPWLQQVQHNPHLGKCTICDMYITAIKSNLQRHENSQEHIRNVKYGKSSVPGEGRSTDEATSTDDTTIMDVGTDSGSDNTFTIPAARNVKKKKRIFAKVWLEDPAFQPWLQQVQHDPHLGKCTFCDVYITAHKCNLQHHANSQKHIKYMKLRKKSVPGERISTNEATNTDGAIIMNVGTDSSSDNTFTNSDTKKAKRQTFMADWLEDPEFQPWLQQVQHDPHLGKCTFCGMCITAKKCNLQQHGKSEKHISNMKYGKRLVPGEGTRSFADDVKEAEVRVCTDAIEHNRPFNSFNHCVQLSQEAYKNPNVLKCMSLSAKKMKAICLNVINKSILKKTLEKVQGKFFSVLIDETTDVSNMKFLCFLIRYVHKERIHTDLLDLIRITDATGNNLYECFRQTLKKYNLPIRNMVGVCVNNANVMVGVHNSLASRLIAANAEMCILPCICHSLHLAACHACECLPNDVEKFLHSLYSYFSQSPKHLSMLEGTQVFLTVKKRKVVQPAPTRWLALAQCIKTMLNQWTVYFCVIAEAAVNESVANKILTNMNSPFTKAYLEFMDHFLKPFTTLNKLFQTSTVLIHRLILECKRLLVLLGTNFIKAQKLKEPDIHKIDIYNEENLLPLTTIFPGTECKNTLSEITNDNLEENKDIIQFYIKIRKCYQTGYQQIVDRVPFDDKFLNALDFLNPQTALNTNDNLVSGKLECILKKFNSKCDRTLVLDEWHALLAAYFGDAEDNIKEMNLLQFWHETSIFKINEDEYLYGNLSRLAQLCLTLPHSNADVERYFSTITQIKTRGRNRLTPETVTALIRIKLAMTNESAHCCNYKITDEMIQLFNNSMYSSTNEISEELLGNILADMEDQSTTDSAKDL